VDNGGGSSGWDGPISVCEPGSMSDEQRPSFIFTNVDQGMVLQCLSKLNVQKATGSDDIYARLLKLAAPAIAKSATCLFNCSLELENYLGNGRQHIITPVHKQGDTELVKTIHQCPFFQ